jgi:DNA-binding NtrC family response regulator
VRELSNAVERAVILASDSVVRRAVLPSVLPRSGGVEPLDDAVKRAEIDAIKRALNASRSRSEAARRLGISRRALYDKLARFGLESS